MSIQEKLHTLNATLFILPAVLFSRNSHLHIMRWQEFRIVSWRAKINMIEFANSILFSSCQTVLFSLPNFAASNLERVTTSLDKKFAQVFGVETTNAFQLAECVVLSRMRKKIVVSYITFYYLCDNNFLQLFTALPYYLLALKKRIQQYNEKSYIFVYCKLLS